MSPKIIDVFLFYNELDLLKARLSYLGPLVDYFVISEANVDFAGRKKEFILNQDLINSLPFGDRVIYHRIDINLKSISWVYKRLKYLKKKNRFLWKIQDEQRNAAITPLKKFNPNDIVIFSDLDEFPSEEGIAKSFQLLQKHQDNKNENSAFSLDQTFYYFNLNNAAPHEKFYGSIIANLKTFRRQLPHKLRSQKNDLMHIEYGGWHFSYFMNEEKILNKIQAISDVENLSAYKKLTIHDIEKKIRSRSDLYDRGTILESEEYKNIPIRLLEIIKEFLPYCLPLMGLVKNKD
jgi:beta-1,4-mannosyl-glycoprotein beta-1,4-N-acetylglucosaminyltransferase